MNNKTIKKCGSLTRGKIESSNSSIHRNESDPREVPLNGFNRFDPKYISIGPKSLRENYNVAKFNKCATLRHGGRYGGSLADRANPVLKKASPPSVAIVSKEFIASKINIIGEINTKDKVKSDIQTIYNGSNSSITGVSSNATSRYDNNESFSYNQSMCKPLKDGTSLLHCGLESHNIMAGAMYKKETPAKSLGPKAQRVLETNRIPPQNSSRLKTFPDAQTTSITSQPLPEIPPKMNQNHRNQQPLSAYNLSKYRALSTPNKQLSNQYRSNQGKSSAVSTAFRKVDQPPMLPPKNKNMQNRSVIKLEQTQSGTKNTVSRENGKNQKKIDNATYSTFGYDCSGRGIDKRSKNFDADPYNNQNKKSFVHANYQTMPNKLKKDSRKECGYQQNDNQLRQYSSSSNRRLDHVTMYSTRKIDELPVRPNHSNRYVCSMASNSDINYSDSTDFTGKTLVLLMIFND